MVLARVIVDVDQVTLTAEGVTQLVKVLRSDDDNAIILAGMTVIVCPVGNYRKLVNETVSGNLDIMYSCWQLATSGSLSLAGAFGQGGHFVYK